MAKETLLREAIADAKAVRETAIANAMLTLKEAFKPQLSSMLAAKLRNEADTMEDMEEQTKLDSSGIGSAGTTVDDPAPKKPTNFKSSDIENPGIEQEPMGEGLDEFGQPTPEGEGNDEFGMDGEQNGHQEFREEDEQGGHDDLDLEAIIRELEADLQGGAGHDAGQDQFGGEHMNDEGVDDSSMETDPAGQEPMGQDHLPSKLPRRENWNTAQSGKKANAGKYAGNDELDETVPNTGKYPEGDGTAPAAVDGFNGGKEVKAGAEQKGGEYGTKDFKKATGSVDEEVDLDEILREMEAESETNESEHITSENVELKRSLREHRSVILLLRNRINEVTLLNSKLMYTTKLFRKFQLSEDQKKKVVEQLDRATTLREAKIVFSTLAETLLNGRSSSDTSRKVAAKITEGASKSVGSTKSKSQSVLNEGDTHVARMQKLAGIIRS